jgi:hypothetical protein
VTGHHDDEDADDEADERSHCRHCLISLHRLPTHKPRKTSHTSAMFGLPPLSRRWKWPKVLIALFVVELLGTVAVLALFGIADPNLYRTKLWQIGFDNGFNSNPKMVLYAYANHRPIPKIPFVWSQTCVSPPAYEE